MPRGGMTVAEFTALEDRAIRLGRKLARQFFETRGNHSEVHISEARLAALLALAIETAEGERIVEASRG